MTRRQYVHTFDLRSLEQRIIDVLNEQGPLDVVELVSALLVSPRQVQATLNVLVIRGTVERGLDENGYRIYKVTSC